MLRCLILALIVRHGLADFKCVCNFNPELPVYSAVGVLRHRILTEYSAVDTFMTIVILY